MSSSCEDSIVCPTVSELSRHVRANNKNGIVTCLTQLRDDPVRCKEFARHGGLNILVKLLRSQRVAILNISLSILANTCISADSRNKILNSNVAENVVHIMRIYKSDSKILCRACRLVGNLSECTAHAELLHNACVEELLVQFLQLKQERPIHLMAIRAVRNLWSNNYHSRNKLMAIEAVKLVTQLFIMAREKSNVDDKYTELVDVCLKAMCTFLKWNPDICCGRQMEVDMEKRGYRCLVQCCKDGNKLATKCLYSLCEITGCRLTLGISGIIEELIAFIKSGSSHLSKEIFIILCLFCRESVNRARISYGGGLEVFVMLLKRSEFEKYHPILLDALAHFVFCDNSMDVLTKHGMVEVLAAKLTNSNVNAGMTTECNLMPINETSRILHCNCLYCDLFSRPIKYNRKIPLDYYCYKRKHFDSDSSPGSASSSPPSTPPLMPDNYMLQACNGDDIYSPVCSDTEWDDNDEDVSTEEADSLKSCKSLTVGTENSGDCERTNKKQNNTAYDCDRRVLLLLSRLSLIPRSIDGLADPTTIKALLTYIKRTKNEKAIMILIKIVRNTAYFMPLLKQGFVFEMQGLHEETQYMQGLCSVAETGGAFGQLSSLLLRGEEEHKLIAAVSIPFLLKSRVMLKPLLHNYGGLRFIFRLLSEPTHDFHNRAIWSICQLAITLHIHTETVSNCATLTRNDSPMRDYSQSCENDNSQTSLTVTFELDDGTTVEACRRTLCHRSDAFSAMLEGNFYESGKQRVKLKNASRDGLNTLILAVNGAAYKDRSIESLLDAVLLADKFLMQDLADELTDSSVAKLGYENFSRAWCWARINACHELKSCCVKSFLTATMTRCQTVRAFHDFFATDAYDEFLQDVQEIIMGALCQP